jgi:hypothetical protein
MIIHQQMAPFPLPPAQAHPALESLPLFRLIMHWKILVLAKVHLYGVKLWSFLSATLGICRVPLRVGLIAANMQANGLRQAPTLHTAQ